MNRTDSLSTIVLGTCLLILSSHGRPGRIFIENGVSLRVGKAVQIITRRIQQLISMLFYFAVGKY